MIPKHRLDYTDTAIAIFDHAKRIYNFRNGRNLDSYLAKGWGELFKRPMTIIDLNNLKAFVKKKKFQNEKVKRLGAVRTHEDSYWENQIIGQDGFVYMTKMITPPPTPNPKETERLEKLLAETSHYMKMKVAVAKDVMAQLKKL